MPGMFGLPRHLTWPIGFTLFLLVMTLILMPLRRRSVLMDGVAKLFFWGTVFMTVMSGIIYMTLAPWEELLQQH